MKRLIIFLAIVFIAAPAMADTWTLNWGSATGLDHIVLHHKAITGTPTAEQFITDTDFTDITLSNTSGQEFTLDYPDGTLYGVWGEAFNAEGDSTLLMDSAMSPRVWRQTAIGEVQDAHWENVVPSVSGEIHVIVDVTVGR